MATVHAADVWRFIQYTGSNSTEVIAGIRTEMSLTAEKVVTNSEVAGVLNLSIDDAGEWHTVIASTGDWIRLQGPSVYSGAAYAAQFFQVD